ncbi:helix-turn-helix transcriptional regulator [Pseudoalteromonas sp. SG44-5]|uniref:helix-turn-helix domain-containing protein n=1 Tax=unclassified Pseudoalteromonas TaxID=194690 RepID=UPI0015CCBAF6|nr:MULTISPECIES: helix-turn-helix transcriptional regulator [unclassified Pseudoalteromonas]MBB1404918.1 helix-turn-helix transcriptional regulator [Pseudoalteromonas sp. SG44-5]NYR11313.1 helix-turn-helix transcriptional regulator [Pseudoalteromonas sp. MIP2626]
MEYSDDVLKKVQLAWSTHRNAEALNQEKAAKAMGMNQSAFSQYLRGAIPLNTDFLTKFTAFTGTEFENLGVKNGAVKGRPVKVKTTLSGRKPSVSSLFVETILESEESYLVEVDYQDYALPKGSMLLINPKGSVRENESVFYVRGGQNPNVVGTLAETEEGWEILEQLWQGGKRYLVDPEDDVSRVVCVYYPNQRGRLFK